MRTQSKRKSLGIVLALGWLGLLTYACSDPAAVRYHVSVRYLAPAVKEGYLQLRTRIPGSEHLEVVLVPEDSMFEPGSADRVRVRVHSSGGDQEDVLLARTKCPGERFCREVLIVMEEGRHAAELGPLLPGVRALFKMITANGKYAELTLIEHEAGELLDTVRRWPGVRGADQSPGVLIGNRPRLFPVGGVVPLSYAPPKQQDRILQVSAGDSVAVIYEAAGNTMIFRAVVPEQ